MAAKRRQERAGPIQADKIKMRPVDWLWNWRIPRKMISIVAGKPDQGKGLFMVYLATFVSTNVFEDPVTGRKRPGRVLYSTYEETHEVMTRPRLEAAGANSKNIDMDEFRLPGDFDYLEDRLAARPYDLIIMDPLASHLSPGISRYNDSIREVTDPLKRLLEQTNAACVVVEHVLKRVSPMASPLAGIGGSSSGIVPASRMAFIFGRDPSDADRRILACVKHNIRDKPAELDFEVDIRDIDPVGEMALIVEQGECNFDPMDLLVLKKGDARMGRPPDKRAAAAEWLANYLMAAGQPVKVGKIDEDAKQMRMTAKTLRAAAKDIKVVKDPPGGGRNCTWWLPDELIDLMQGQAAGGGPEDGADSETDSDSLMTEEDYNKLLNGNEEPEEEEPEDEGEEGEDA